MFICQPRLSRRKYLSKCFIKWFMNFRYYFHAFMILWLLFWHQQLVKVSDYPVKCRKICSNSMSDIHCPQMMNPNDSDEPLIFLLVPQTDFWFSFGVFLRETSPQLFDNSLWHSLNIHFPLRMNYNNCNHSWVFSSPGQHLSLSLFFLTFLVFVIKCHCYDTFIHLSRLLCPHGSGLCWPAHRWVTFLTTHVGHRVTSPQRSVREPIREQDT